MEAKDTITKCVEEATEKAPIEVMTNGALIGLEKREMLIAEISFKAGIKEVLEFAQKHPVIGYRVRPEWQVKLKEWGVANNEPIKEVSNNIC